MAGSLSLSSIFDLYLTFNKDYAIMKMMIIHKDDEAMKKYRGWWTC